MYQFAAAQQKSTVKLPAFFQRFQTEERVLRVNESKITDENIFNGGYFETESKDESNNDEKIWFWVFLQICDPCFPLRPQNMYIYVFEPLFGFCNF